MGGGAHGDQGRSKYIDYTADVKLAMDQQDVLHDVTEPNNKLIATMLDSLDTNVQAKDPALPPPIGFNGTWNEYIKTVCEPASNEHLDSGQDDQLRLAAIQIISELSRESEHEPDENLICRIADSLDERLKHLGTDAPAISDLGEFIAAALAAWAVGCDEPECV